jgi:hypothetical protein
MRHGRIYTYTHIRFLSFFVQRKRVQGPWIPHVSHIRYVFSDAQYNTLAIDHIRNTYTHNYFARRTTNAKGVIAGATQAERSGNLKKCARGITGNIGVGRHTM